jgi:hypothetical protein
VKGGTLVTACGSFNTVSGTPSIFGKVYSGTSAPSGAAKPPTDASEGTCVGNGSSNPTWHFNSCSPPLAGCVIGSMHTMRIWVTGSNEGCYFTADSVFQGCDSTAAGCSVDCPEMAPGEPPAPPAAYCPPVIAKLASRFFVVRPAHGISGLLDLFGVTKAVMSRWNIQLAYSEAASSLGMAVWLSPTVLGEHLRLEVTCGPCCTQAMLARIRLHKTAVETLDCWRAECFDVVKGGDLRRLLPRGAEGGVSVRPPVNVAPPLPTAAASQVAGPPASATRATRGRRTGRGRR